MTALKKAGLLIIVALLAALLLGCGEPAADQENIEEDELQEEVEENDEEANEEEENDQENDRDNGSGSTGNSNSGFSHTVEMNINGEVKEGENEEWWKDEEGGNEEQWWDD